ncbi:hypothetical protein [Halopiger xanaduensis]|uniref:Thioredoxin domain-containing protein n=1 Tax=Halopiger xanaduensis (strain DSM 18323 / JCM 14033 / SH-6) TaxID=797210 RepID=F8DD07_HALXS|nr:hypothetical protein [Halopiger xanaduensis]AEH38480.1 hypothetical protein Halxa_3875 [Halopiger xanaduensis SH-6]
MADRSEGTVDRRTLLRGLGAGSIVTLAGCAAGDDGNGGGNDGGDDDSIDPEPVDVDESATWRTTTLEDVLTGETFAIEEFDRPAVVHTFAVGCAVCHSQHRQFVDLQASETDVEIVDLTIDPDYPPERVSEHATDEGFDWRFGVSPEAVTSSLVDDFGQEVTVSASSPLVLVYPNGETYRLEKIVDAGPLASVIEEYR